MMARSRATERGLFFVFLLPSRLRRKLSPGTLAIRVRLPKKNCVDTQTSTLSSLLNVCCVAQRMGKIKIGKQQRNRRKL